MNFQNKSIWLETEKNKSLEASLSEMIPFRSWWVKSLIIIRIHGIHLYIRCNRSKFLVSRERSAYKGQFIKTFLYFLLLNYRARSILIKRYLTSLIFDQFKIQFVCFHILRFFFTFMNKFIFDIFWFFSERVKLFWSIFSSPLDWSTWLEQTKFQYENAFSSEIFVWEEKTVWYKSFLDYLMFNLFPKYDTEIFEMSLSSSAWYFCNKILFSNL